MSGNVQGVQSKQIFNYIIMPGIVPRLRGLFASGFGFLAALMAQIYFMVRLLPAGHPYLNPENKGKFGIRHVIAAAANNLVVKKENIDQIAIFVAMLAGSVLLVMQFVILIYAFLFQPAEAQGMFTTPTPNTDVAFMLMDHVFGIPDMFNSCVSSGALCDKMETRPAFPTPFHIALHDLFSFYSIALLIVAVLIFLYFVVTVVVETAISGTPFGQRFSNMWVPIRLVTALALLVPIHHGLNSGQYLALYAGKLGSGMATNAWLRFNQTIVNENFDAANPTGEGASLIAKPTSTEISPVLNFMSLVHACAYSNWIDESTKGSTGIHDEDALIKAYFVKTPLIGDPRDVLEVTMDMNYAHALQFFDNSDIVITFGELDKDNSDYNKYTANVKPICGEVRIPIGNVTIGADEDPDQVFNEAAKNGGPAFVLAFYYELIKQIWFDFDSKELGVDKPEWQQFSQRMVEFSQTGNADWLCDKGELNLNTCANDFLPSCTGTPAPCSEKPPGAEWKQKMIERYQVLVDSALNLAWAKYALGGADVQINADILERGWGGAGIWYNRIAELNGSLITSFLNLPTLKSYPLVMQEIRDTKRREDPNVDILKQFEPTSSTSVKLDATEKKMASSLNFVFQYWNKDQANQTDQETDNVGNVFEMTMNILFGTKGLFEMRRENAHTHPMAQLVALGKSLVESAIRNLAGSTLFAFGGGLAMATNGTAGKTMTAVGGFLQSTAFLGLTAGVVLFYVLPFLPFIYFYFAVGQWIKALFESMVGIPLWALAHLRIDGEGLSGEAAANGYLLIFEIFLRPILTVFGLIAAIVIFAAQVRILHFIWDLVITNVGGFNDEVAIELAKIETPLKRSVVDQFFFTLVYTLMVYMMATASFKLIDRIPDNMLRWMGGSVSSFGDISKEDPAGKITQYAAISGVTVGQQFTKGLTDTAGQLGSALNPPKPPPGQGK